MNKQLLNILLVEDNEDHAELVKRNLEEFRVHSRLFHVQDGEAALNYLLGQAEFADASKYPRPSLVLLDLRLPKVDGLEVLRTVKNNPSLHQIPIIVLTTSAAELDIARAYEYHANSFVTKPVDFDALNLLLKDLGSYWLAWNINA